MKRLLLVFIVFIIGTIMFNEFLFSQFGRFPIFPRSMRPRSEFKYKQPKVNMFNELKLDLGDWIKDSVVPDLSKMKKRLDSSISSEDLRVVDSLRRRAYDLNKELTEVKNSRNKRYKKDQSEIIKDDYRQIANAIKPYKVKYKKSIDSICLEQKAKIQKWEGGASDFIVKWLDKNNYNLTDKEKEALEYYWKFEEKIKGIRFLLWDGVSALW